MILPSKDPQLWWKQQLVDGRKVSMKMSGSAIKWREGLTKISFTQNRQRRVR
jgi:hypothetical protein